MSATRGLQEADFRGIKLVEDGGATGALHVVVDSQTGSVPAGTSENHIGSVGGDTALVTPTITVDTAIYASGDSIGGKITLANAIRVAGLTGVLQSIQLLDRSNQKPLLEIFIFDSDPTAATITNNAAFVFSTDDLKVLGRISVIATDWVTVNSKAMASLRSLGMILKAASGTSLFAAIVINGSTPTFVATTDFQMRVGILQD